MIGLPAYGSGTLSACGCSSYTTGGKTTEIKCAAHRVNVTQRRIVCAAIRAADGELLLGIRHYSADIHRQIAARRDGAKFTNRHDSDQGFVDQHGLYLTREEAYSTAMLAGQIIRPDACGMGLDGPKLYSEGLY